MSGVREPPSSLRMPRPQGLVVRSLGGNRPRHNRPPARTRCRRCSAAATGKSVPFGVTSRGLSWWRPKLQDAQSPGAGDDDFGTAVFVQVTTHNGSGGTTPRNVLHPQPAGLSAYCGSSSAPVSLAWAHEQADLMETTPWRLELGLVGSAAAAGVASIRASMEPVRPGVEMVGPVGCLFVCRDCRREGGSGGGALAGSRSSWKAPE